MEDQDLSRRLHTRDDWNVALEKRLADIEKKHLDKKLADDEGRRFVVEEAN